MSTISKNMVVLSTINEEIQAHSAWLGVVSGLHADKLLRGQSTPFLYVLRAGERQSQEVTDYYVTYIRPDGSIHHCPFVISIDSDGWYYENSAPCAGPFTGSVSIDDVLYRIMHCTKGECTPLVRG